MALSNKISIFVGKAGELLAVNPFYGRMAPAAPSGYQLLTFDRPTFSGSPVADAAIKTDYEITDGNLVRK